MPRLVSLKVNNLDKNVVKTIPVDVGLQVHDAVRFFFSKFAEITDMQKADVKEYGLFLANLEDSKTGVWLEAGRTLDYYMLGDGDMIFFKRKLRMLKVSTLDGNVKTIQVDDSQTVGNLMVVICTKLGIMNHDEYSLTREVDEDEKKENTKPAQFGTLTLGRRKKDDKDKDKDTKMESLKKKVGTDDDLNWVDHGKSLREQGIDESEILRLRRKFFYSDRNIDASDPVQLNLIFVQARDAILNGMHPVTFKEACMFAGIQCQIQFGDHVESKHKPGFLELQEFLPKSYMKQRNVEKVVFTEHKQHKGLTEIEAKASYVREARSLKTYGVAFFLVKEKMTGKNKLVPRLLGITKDSVLRLDEKTKEILKTWYLTTVRRWAASPNTFTLDFGDYADQYYSVQTTEGEQIAQLISGYIDIILKRKAAKDYQGQLGDEGNMVEEDIVSPYKAQIIERPTVRSDAQKVKESNMAQPGIIGGVAEPQTVGVGHMQAPRHSTSTGIAAMGNQPPSAHQPHIIQLSEPQRALIKTISGGKSAVEVALKELDEYFPDIPDLGTDPASLQWKQTTLDTSKQTVSSQIAAMNAATAQVVTLTGAPPEDVDHTGVGAAISTITTNLPEMTRGVKTIAALTDEDSENLLTATRTLCNAFSELLKATEPESKEPRQTLLNAASRVGEASHHVLSTIQEEDDIDKEVHDVLLALAKAVANATAALVLKAKSVASKCSDKEMQSRVIDAATTCALATSQLVACAKVVAPTIGSPACQEQIIEAAKGGGRAVNSIVTVCRESCPDGQLLQEMGSAAADVTKALNDLLHHIRGGYRERAQESVSDGAVDTILVATDRLFASSGDSAEMVRQAKILAQATAQLIAAIKMEAEQQTDGDLQKRLLAAATTLANATSRLVDAAKQCANSPQDSENQLALRKAAESLRSATSVAASAALKKKLIKRLENAAKHAASTATQCIAASQGVGPYNSNVATQEELMADCRDVADCIPRLVEGVKGSASQPDSAACQLTLIDASESFLHPGQKMVSSAKSVLPTVDDQSASLQLSNSNKQFSAALADLRAAMGRAAEACGGQLQMDSALDMIKLLDEELQAFKKAVDALELKPLPGDPQGEAAAAKLSSTSKTVGANMAGLLTAASQGNESYTGHAARDTAASLKDLTKAVRSVAASTNDPQVQGRIIGSAREVMESSMYLILESKEVIKNPQSTQNQQRLTQVAKDVSQALNKCVNCLPGQKDVDEAIETISSVTLRLNTSQYPQSNKSYGELQSNLNSAAANLNEASNEVVTTAKSPTRLATSSKHFGNAFGELVGVGMEMAGQSRDTEVRGQMVVSMKNVSVVSSKLLVAAKHVAADPNAPNAKNQLATAARGVTDSINQLINVCTSAAPGQKECDNAIRQIRSLAPLLDQPSEPVNDSSYFQCLDLVMEKSKALGDGMTGIANHAKKSSHEDFGSAVTGVSEAVCGLIEAAAQAAYLLAVSEPSSVAGRPGLVDQSHFSRAASAINSACQQLTGPSATQQQVLSAATVIAKHTSALCNSCRVASSKTSNPVAKRHFVQSAKDVANATAALVNEIKALDMEYSDANRSKCSAATNPLLDAVSSLCAFASSPEFASVPAKISNDARRAQFPITESGKNIIEGSCAMIHAAKSLAVNPKDPPTWQSLANHSKSVSDAIKNLVSSIRDAAPGQKECDDAIELLGSCIRELDQASLDAISQKLSPRTQRTLQGFNEQTRGAAQEILERIDKVKESAEGEAEAVGHAVSNLCNYFSPLVVNATGLASHMVSSKQQSMILDQVKTVAECALQLVYAAKEAGGNPKAFQAHGDLAEAAAAMKESGRDLMNTLETVATSAGVVHGLLDGLTKAMLRTDDSTVSVSEETFVDYQTRMVNEAKEIAVISQDMVAKSTSSVSELCTLAGKLRDHYSNLANDCKGCAAATSNSEVATRIKTSVQHLGQGCIELVKAAGSLQTSPNDTFCQRELSEAGKIVSERVCTVLAALQSGSRGTQACINAASTVSGIIGDLDTTIMFATAGTLHSETDEDTFADHRENILKTAKALVEDTKTLVSGAASSQEQLAVAAQNSVATIVQLSEVVKFGAASLGSSNTEAQVLLINAVKDVASALGDLIQATKSASGNPQADPARLALKDSAKVMVTNVTSLLKTVKVVEDEHTRGTRALEATIEAIAQEIRAYDSNESPRNKTTPEALIRATKPITLATAKAVAAGNSGKQDDIIVAANMGRKAISDLLTTCKAAAWDTDNGEIRDKALQAGHDCAVQYRELLQMVLNVINRPGHDARQMLPPVSRKIATCVTDIVSVAENLKGSDWVDPEDPTVIAENELLGAASSIDAAAKKLLSLRPRRPSVREVDENLNFDEMILNACKSITAAASALVKAASAAQRDLLETGKVTEHPHLATDDGQWSEGLISAARLVAAATHSLCEAANALVQGHATEEKLISSAKQVASSTAQLLVACRVKADPDSVSMKRLQSAGNTVKRATDNLVKAAQAAIDHNEEINFTVSKRFVGGMADEIRARTEVLEKEKELEKARVKLAAIRKAKYPKKNMDDSDTDGYLSGYDSSRELNISGDGSRPQIVEVSYVKNGGSSCDEDQQQNESFSVSRNISRFEASSQPNRSFSSFGKSQSSSFSSKSEQRIEKTVTMTSQSLQSNRVQYIDK